MRACAPSRHLDERLRGGEVLRHLLRADDSEFGGDRFRGGFLDDLHEGDEAVERAEGSGGPGGRPGLEHVDEQVSTRAGHPRLPGA